jgi:hypothetical protein
MAGDDGKITGRQGDQGIGKRSRQKAVDKKRRRNTDRIRRSQNTASANFRYRKVWGLKPKVQCLNDSTDERWKRILLILHDFWVKNSS